MDNCRDESQDNCAKHLGWNLHSFAKQGIASMVFKFEQVYMAKLKAEFGEQAQDIIDEYSEMLQE